jgi:hypothetical protein
MEHIYLETFQLPHPVIPVSFRNHPFEITDYRLSHVHEEKTANITDLENELETH